MEPKENQNVEQAIKNFNKMDEEIGGKPTKLPTMEEEVRNRPVTTTEPEEPPVPHMTPQGDRAMGYNPDFNHHRPNELQPEGLDKPKQPDVPHSEKQIPEKQPVEAPPQKKEGAPDIGKDYGDSLGNPGQKAEPVSRDPKARPPKSEQQPQGEQPQGEQGTPNGANRPNELEQAKQEAEAKKEQEKQEQQKDDTKKEPEGKRGNEQNPEAPQAKKPEKKDATPEKEGAKKEGPQAPNNGVAGKKNEQAPTRQNDSTERARKNLEHNNRVRKGNEEETGRRSAATNRPREKSSSEEGGSGLSSLGAKAKNAFSNFFNRGSKNSIGKGNGKSDKKASNAFKGAMKRKILAFFAAHPWALVILVLLIFILILLLVSTVEDMSSGGKGKKGTKCTYNLNGVTLSGSVELSNLQVELINCDGKASDYTVLETIDFEKYVLGVALAEIGPYTADEAIKTQIIAARNFALTRNSGMCPGNPDNCFYGYNVSTGKIRMRACEADQVYWDYEKDIYRQARGAISLYSPEVNSGTIWKTKLDDTRKQQVLELANSVKGQVLVDSSNKVIPTPYVANTSEQFISLAAQGKTYDEILKTVYDSASDISSATCSSYGNIDYGDYVLSSEGNEILHQPLDDFLVAKGSSLDEFNGLISANVDKAGYGTRAGVVAAAVTLIAELGNNYGVKVPYYWGGGHYDGVVDGALGYWGSTQCHTYANNQNYNYCGLDCSGFVPWAIKNGGFNMVQNLAGNFQNLQGAKRVSLSSSPVLEPGDLLESSGHIVLVVGVDESAGVYICAEASGNQAGVLFTRRSFNESGYWGVQMDGYYDTHARSK